MIKSRTGIWGDSYVGFALYDIVLFSKLSFLADLKKEILESKSITNIDGDTNYCRYKNIGFFVEKNGKIR